MGEGVSGAASPLDGATSSGRWYFEARITGVCAMVGVAQEDFLSYQQPGSKDSWVFGDAGFGGMLLHDEGKAFGLAISQGATIGVAYDSSTGQIWFAKDGLWMQPSPSTLQGEAMLATDYRLLKPVFGVAADCVSPVPVAITARFKSSDFQYELPVGFTALVQDPCACTEALSMCLQDGNCLSHEMQKTIYQQCSSDGCSKAQCGFTPGVQSTFCLRDESEDCEHAYAQCVEPAQQPGDECACTKELLQCFQTSGCVMDDSFLSSVASLCMHAGCNAQECGICESRCNSTALSCNTHFMQCGIQANTSEHHCACVASLYHCTQDCLTEDSTLQHAALCHDLGCKASECGLPDTYKNCNSSSTRCHRELMACRDKEAAPMKLSDTHCHQNYQEKHDLGQSGPDVCSVPWAGGIAGCHYNKITDTCSDSESIDCQCTKDYIGCLREDGCEASQDTFQDMCVQDRCSPEQCGLEISPVFCKRAEQQCNMEYAKCEAMRYTSLRPSLVVSSGNAICLESHCMENGLADPDCCGFRSETHCAPGFSKLETGPGQEVCSENSDGKRFQTCCQASLEFELQILDCSGQCLRTYFHCVDRAGCAAMEQVVQHRDYCLYDGCSAEECGFSKTEEALVAPPKPDSVVLSSLSDARLRAKWEDADQILEWALTGSRNHIAQYMIAIDGSCSTSFTTDGIAGAGVYCQEHVQSINMSAMAQQQLVLPLCQDPARAPQSPNAYIYAQTSITELSISHIYRVAVFSINQFGMSTSPSYAVRRLAGKPGAPPSPIITQTSPHSLRIVWNLPSNTGDGTRLVILTGYTLQVWHNPTMIWPRIANKYPNTFRFPQSIQSFESNEAVGGAFTKCANLGQTCYCQGIVRLGFGNQWSPPFESHNFIHCSVGENFPDVAPSAQQVCHCNSVAIPRDRPQRAQIGLYPFPLSAGRKVRACVSATNELGHGPFSVCSEFQVVGRPGKVENFLMTAPNTRELKVSWSAPLDWGLGVNSFTGILITKYEIVISTCKQFVASSTCSVKMLLHSSSSCPASGGGCTATIPETNNLVENTVYYIYVVATNKIGRGYIWNAQRWMWKLRPTIQFPLADAFPLRAVEWDGYSVLWNQGSAQSSIELFVQNFPLVEISNCGLDTTCSSKRVSAIVRINGQDIVARVIVNSRQKIVASADLKDELGHDIMTGLTFFPPLVGGNKITGSAKVTLKVIGNFGLEASFQMIYFKYPEASIDLFSPNQGIISGGTLLRFEITEPRGPETRQGANLLTFALANIKNLEVVFTNPNTGVKTPGKLEQVQGQGDRISINVRSPNIGGLKMFSPIQFLVAGLVMPVNKQIAFQYRIEYLTSVVPASGVTLGGFTISIIVIGMTAPSVSNVEASIADVACAAVAYDFNIKTQLKVSCTVPPVSSTTLGLATIRVSWREGSVTQSVSSDTLFSFVKLPALLIIESSIVIAGASPGQAVVFTSSSSMVTFRLQYIGLGDTTLITFGNALATSVMIRQFHNDDIRESYSIVQCNTPTTLAAGSYTLEVTTSSVRYGTRTATSTNFISFRNLAVPSILDTFPSGGRMAGGGVIVASVMSMCTNLCPPAGINVLVDSQTTTVLGSITLQSWKSKDSKYDTFVGASTMSSFLVDISAERSQQIKILVEHLDTIVAGNAAALPSNVFLVFFTAPDIIGATTSTRESTIRVSAGSSTASLPYTLFANPIGQANVESAVPSSGSIKGGTRVTVILSNFLIVNVPSDLDIKVGGEMASKESVSILSSTQTATQLSFLMPPMADLGKKSLLLIPVVLPSNEAEFELSYTSDRPATVLSMTPEEVYTTGGEIVTGVIANFGFPGITSADVTVSMKMNQGGTGDSEVFLSSFTLSFDDSSQRCTIILTTKAMPTGLATITMQISGGNQLAIAYLVFVAIPTGVPIMACEPSSGSTSGGDIVSCFLQNFRKVSSKSQLRLKYEFNDNLGANILNLRSNAFLTVVTFTTPAYTGDSAKISIWAPQYSSTPGKFSFTTINPKKASLLYASPRVGIDSVKNTIKVGMGNMGLLFTDVSFFTATATTVSAPGVAIVDVGIKVLSMRSSTLLGTHMILEIGPSPLPKLELTPNIDKIQVRVRVTSVIESNSANTGRFVEFAFTYQSAMKPHIQSFSPLTYYAEGRVPLYMRVMNTAQVLSLQDNAYVDFGADTEHALVTSITYRPGGIADLIAYVPELAISINDDGKFLSQPVLVVPNVVPDKVLNIKFLEPFAYTESPRPQITDVFPNSGSIDAQTEVELQVRDMPGISNTMTDFVVKFASTQATVIGFERVNERLPEAAIQDIVLRVRTPCCTPQTLAGKVSVRVFHIEYQGKIAVTDDTNDFKYYNPSEPILTSVVGDNNGAFAKFNDQTSVTIHLRNVFQSIQTATLSCKDAFFFDYNIKSNGIFYSSSRKTVRITALIIVSTAKGRTDLSIRLNGAEIKFQLEFYDARLPQLTAAAPLSGTRLQKTKVAVVISKFPVLQTPLDVVVQVGSFGTSFGSSITVTSSTPDFTHFHFLVHGGTLDGLGVQSIKMIPIDHPSKAVTFDFDFIAVQTLVNSVSKTSIFMTGGTVTVVIDYFHPVLTGGEILVTLGDSELNADSVTVKSSSFSQTELEINFGPSTAGDGQIVTVTPLLLGMSGAATFSLNIIIEGLLQFSTPLPTAACQRDEGAIFYLYLKNVASSASPNQISIRYQTQAFAISTLLYNSVSQVTTVKYSISVSSHSF